MAERYEDRTEGGRKTVGSLKKQNKKKTPKQKTLSIGSYFTVRTAPLREREEKAEEEKPKRKTERKTKESKKEIKTNR